MTEIVVPLDRWITLSGPPGPADGVLGTYAIDTASVSYDLYVKQEAGWVFLVSLIGPQGDTGASAYDIAVANGFSGTEAVWLDSLVGPQGDRGYTILSGASDPVPSDGIDGDFWLNTASSTLFGPKAGGAFPAGVSLIGPTGAGVPSGGANGQYIRHDGVSTVWESPGSRFAEGSPTGATDGQAWTYDAATGAWKPYSLASGDVGAISNADIPNFAGDLNTLRGTQFWRINRGDAAVVNAPPQLSGDHGWFYLSQIEYNGSWISQVARDLNDNHVQSRNQENGVWQPWRIERPEVAGDVGAAPTSRQVATGPGLTGGGDLSANRTIQTQAYHWFDVDRVGGTDIPLSSGVSRILSFERAITNDPWWNTVRYSPLENGIYMFYVGIRFRGVGIGATLRVSVLKNGARTLGRDLFDSAVAGSGIFVITSSMLVPAVSGDYFQVEAQCTGSGATIFGESFNFFYGGYWRAL